MDIVSRLKIFLNTKGISNSVFADSCEIPRPTLSQLLTGRNKKVSDEIIKKIHQTYPSLSIMWLMFGEGPMEEVSGPNANNGNDAQLNENPKNATLFDNLSNNSNLASRSNTIDFNADSQVDYEAGVRSAGRASQVHQNDSLRSTPPNMINDSSMQMNVSNGKRVVNIIVYYNDNSFDKFVLENK